MKISVYDYEHSIMAHVAKQDSEGAGWDTARRMIRLWERFRKAWGERFAGSESVGYSGDESPCDNPFVFARMEWTPGYDYSIGDIVCLKQNGVDRYGVIVGDYLWFFNDAPGLAMLVDFGDDGKPVRIDTLDLFGRLSGTELPKGVLNLARRQIRKELMAKCPEMKKEE